MEKKLIQRNLPLTATYVLEWLKHGSVEHGDCWQCENCGAAIVNMASIRDESGKSYIVGHDCMKTLTLKPTIESRDMLEDYKGFTAFLSRCNKAEGKLEMEGSRVFLKIPKASGWGHNHYSEAVCNIEQFMGMDRFAAKYL